MPKNKSKKSRHGLRSALYKGVVKEIANEQEVSVSAISQSIALGNPRILTILANKLEERVAALRSAQSRIQGVVA